MALRIPGKGNFKPVKPVRPGKRPAVGPPRPSQPSLSQASQKPTVTQPTQPTQSSQPPAQPSQASQKPPVSQDDGGLEKTDEPADAVTERLNEKTDEIVRKPALGAKKVKPLLAAAAAAKNTPSKPSPSAPPPPPKPVDEPSVPIVAAASSPPPPTPAPAPIPAVQDFAPPIVTATESLVPPSVEAASAELPPSFASSSIPPSVASAVPNTVDLASQIVDEISPFDDHDPPPRASSSRRVRTRRDPTPAKRLRAIARHRKDRELRDLDYRNEREHSADTTRSGSVMSTRTDDKSDDEASVTGSASPAARKFRGKYQSRGRGGTGADRRSAPYRRPKPQVSHPELDGVEANDLVGAEVNPSVMRLGELATTLVSQGRVSARALKLHDFQRAEDERKRKNRVTKTEENWRRRQVVRRKARQIRNQNREERREEARERGGNLEDISDDSADSDEEFEPMPDRLTPPPGSPQFAERVAPLRFEPEAEAPPEEGAEGDEAAAAEAPAEEDIEGLGFHVNQDEDVEMGEEMEDFQLPVEDDGEEAQQDFSGLGGTEYTGGYLDDEGQWVEGGPDMARIQQRQDDYRRRIMDGDDDRQVELIDNDTQFVNSATWGKKVANDRWTSEETELFFSVLRETGENYTLMKAYFPGRSVRQLKNKGLKENRANPDRMNEAIFNRKPIDTEYLAKAAGFNTEDPYDRENAFLKEVAEEKERLALIPLEPDVEDGEAQPQNDDPAWDLEFGDGS